MKEKHITIGIICVALYAIIGGWISSAKIKEAEEARKRVQEQKQGIFETLQKAKAEDKIYREYGDL